MVRNPPASAGDTGLIPALGRVQEALILQVENVCVQHQRPGTAISKLITKALKE